MADDLSIVSIKTEQRPRYFEFTKNDLIAPCPGMPSLTYDPYPDAKNNEVVRREVIGHEIVLTGTIKAAVGSLHPGVALNVNGLTFLLRQSTEHVNTANNHSTFEVEGFCPMNCCQEPMKVLAQLRQSLGARAQPRELSNPSCDEGQRNINLRLRPSFCAFLDILGFAEVINRAYVDKKENQLLKEISGALSASAERIKSAAGRDSIIKAKFFTDNVIIGYSHEMPRLAPALWNLCELVADFQMAMACRGLFVRGGISLGTLAIDGDFVFGDCLVKAHLLESTMAHSPRVVLDPLLKTSVEKELCESSEMWRNTWNSHLLLDTDDVLFVNYLSASYERRLKPPDAGIWFPSEQRLMEHRTVVETQMRTYRSSPKVWWKYFWTANYHNSFCDRLEFGQCRIQETLLHPEPRQL